MNRLTPMSGGFLFVLAQNMEEMEGLGPETLFYSAKGVRISLGGNGRIISIIPSFVKRNKASSIQLNILAPSKHDKCH